MAVHKSNQRLKHQSPKLLGFSKGAKRKIRVNLSDATVRKVHLFLKELSLKSGISSVLITNAFDAVNVKRNVRRALEQGHKVDEATKKYWLNKLEKILQSK